MIYDEPTEVPVREVTTEVPVREVAVREAEFVDTAVGIAGGLARFGLGLLRIPLALLPRETQTHTLNALRELSYAFATLPGDFADIAGVKIEEWAARGDDPAAPAQRAAARVDAMIEGRAASASAAASGPAAGGVSAAYAGTGSDEATRATPLKIAVTRPTQEVASAASGVRITHLEFDPPGRDLDGEYVLIRNTSANSVDLDGWTLDDTSNHHFRFASFTLAAGAEVKIWTKIGIPDASNLYFASNSPIWNNSGDTATLRDASGTIVQAYTYQGSKPL